MADRSVNGKDAAAAPDPAATAGAQRLPPSLARGDCAPRPRLAYAAEFTFVADGWQRSDGRMVRTTSAFLMRWTKRGLGLWSTGARCAGSCASRQFANGPERGRFPGAHALPFPPVPYCTLFAATCAFSVARPSLRRPLPYAIPRSGGGPSRSVLFRLRVLIAQKL